ncbi:MAG: (2Fe-2S)-binding protein [Deltaproteobacteria bacterium]|nr:(2Fe-2S)-binding protein [Deltaproteobacteria bacterium]
MAHKVTVRINGSRYQAEVEPRTLLVHMLRDTLRLTGTHVGCVVGRCGACTVLWNDVPVKSCMVFAIQVENDEIVTVEGLKEGNELHPIQKAFWNHDAVECGYCTPGMLMASYGLLKNETNPTEEQIKRAISGNLCRCTGYRNIVEAIKDAAARMRAGEAGSAKQAV